MPQGNSVLRAYRESRGWSQKRLADQLDTSKEMISRGECGQRVPSPYYREKLCHIFDATTDELGLLVSPQMSASSPTSPLMPSPSLISVERAPQDIIASLLETGGQALEVSRRQVLHSMLDAACSSLVFSPYLSLAPDSIQHLAKTVAQNWRVNTHVLNDLEIVTRQYWKLSANISFEVLSGAIGHFQTMSQLLQQPSSSADVSSKLHSMIGEVAQIIGKILFDLNEYQLAWKYYAFSMSSAQTAGNFDLWAVGYGRMSLLAMSNGQRQEAQAMVKNGLSLDIRNSRVQAWLSVIQAEVFSYQDDESSFERAIEHAEEISQEMASDDDTYATGFNVSRLAGYQGAGYIRLSQPEKALNALQKAYQFLPSTSIRRQAVLNAHLGTVYAMLGEAHMAQDYVSQSLDIISQTRSLNTLQQVLTVRKKLLPLDQQGTTRELDDRIKAVYQQIKASQVHTAL